MYLKEEKRDSIFEFSSDCDKIIFYEHLASFFRISLIHGHISSVLLLATLVPILKDKLGDICDSNNYRSIAISSLILKVFDWVIILLYGDKLNLDQLQFSYQPNISTNTCAWMAIETIDCFTRNGLMCLYVLWTCQKLLTGLNTVYYSNNLSKKFCLNYIYACCR